MILIEDTRQKVNKHNSIKDFCEKNGIELIRKYLDCGDYMIRGINNISVDTKLGLSEVYSNVIADHKRFTNECIRAKEKGLKLIILVADEHITSVDEVKFWSNPRQNAYKQRAKATHRRTAAPVEPVRLCKFMKTMTERYGVEWDFCPEREMGQKVVKIITSYNVDNSVDNVDK